MSASKKSKKRSQPTEDGAAGAAAPAPAPAAAAGAGAGAAAAAAAPQVDAKTGKSSTGSAKKAEGREKKKQSRQSREADAAKAASGDAKKDELEDLVFEDDFEDQVDSEDEELQQQIAKMTLKGEKIGDARDSDSEDERQVTRADALKQTGVLPPKQKADGGAGAAGDAKAMTDDAAAAAAEEEDDDEEDDEGTKRVPQTKVWRPSDGMGEDEQLEYDSKFYSCYHALKADWPCLSFDIIRDRAGELRTKFPLSMYMVTGTQAAQGQANKILVMKVSDIHRTKHDDSENDDDDEEEDDAATDDDPILGVQTIDCDGEVNRIRSMPQQSNFVASWQSTGHVHIWNTIEQLKALDSNGPAANQKINTKPVFSFAHTVEEKLVGKGRGGAAAAKVVRRPVEGFAIDWSGVMAGRLATGDGKAGLYVWDYKESSWQVDQNAFKGHTASIEDIQWSPNEANVFATCSSDKTIRIWDTRQAQRQAIRWVVAHKSDVNVISWNRKTPAFLVSGSDDASIKIWDFRKFTSNNALAHFKFHSQPITSVEWHPHEDSVFAASSADNSVSVWDLALERDADFKAEGAAIDEKEYPPQLYFVHRGQTDIKEVHFHPQVPALMLSTAADGFNIFKPANMELTPQQLAALSQPYKAPGAGPAGAAAAGAAGAAAPAVAAPGGALMGAMAGPNKPTA